MDYLSSAFESLGVSVGIALEGRPKPIYLLGQTPEHMCYLDTSSCQSSVHRVTSSPPFDHGQLYSCMHPLLQQPTLIELTEHEKRTLLKRGDFAFATFKEYHDSIIPALLLGCRMRDYEQSCGTVTGLCPLRIRIPPMPHYVSDTLQFLTKAGDRITVVVSGVNRSSDKSIEITGSPYRSTLPKDVAVGSRLEYVWDHSRPLFTPIVTEVLSAHHRHKVEAVNWNLLERIYGSPAAFSNSTAHGHPIRIGHRGRQVELNTEQSEAVRRYLSDGPAFAVESPPGSGKTLTTAAMAVTYFCQKPNDSGIQLLLSTANVAVYTMAIELYHCDRRGAQVAHIMSANWEAAQTDEQRSPFSVLADDGNPNAADFKAMRRELQYATGRDQRQLKASMRRSHAAAVATSGCDFDILLGTVDTILAKWWLNKRHPRARPCPIKTLMQRRGVARVVVGEASQLTEAALNALILTFPYAQIVLIGDSRQLPPFKYVPGDIASELAATSALDVLKRKRNLPVITMRQVYRAAQSLIRHYSDTFYNGTLVSRKQESRWRHYERPLFQS